MRWQAGVLPRQDASLIGNELAEKIGVLVVERIDGEINLRLWPRRAFLHRPRTSTAISAVRFVGMCLARHKLLDFFVDRVAAQRGIILLNLHAVRVQFLVFVGRVTRRRFAFFARLGAFQCDNFARLTYSSSLVGFSSPSSSSA